MFTWILKEKHENRVNIIQQCVSKPYISFKTFKIIMNAMNFINIKMQHVVQDRNSSLNENMIASHINAKITYKLGWIENQHKV